MKTPRLSTKAVDLTPARLASSLRSDSLLARSLRPVANRLLPSEETVVTVRSGAAKGLKLPIDPQHEKYYWTGSHEAHVQEAIVRILDPGMCFWDVGSHIGFFTAIAARILGDSGSVVAFEPLPETRNRLQQTIAVNGFSNVTVSGSAVGDSNRSRVLHPPREMVRGCEDLEGPKLTTMWTLMDEWGANGGVEVECETLDALAISQPPPDLVKIDAEGAEIEVLAGGAGLLSRGTTRALVEMTDTRTLERARVLLPDSNFEHVGENHWLIG